MGVDLGLQGFQLQVLDLPGVLHPLLHKAVYTVHHPVEPTHKLSDLVVALRF